MVLIEQFPGACQAVLCYGQAKCIQKRECVYINGFYFSFVDFKTKMLLTYEVHVYRTPLTFMVSCIGQTYNRKIGAKLFGRLSM